MLQPFVQKFWVEIGKGRSASDFIYSKTFWMTTCILLVDGQIGNGDKVSMLSDETLQKRNDGSLIAE